MAAPFRFELQGDGGNFTFDIEGVPIPTLEAEYKVASDPRVVVALRERWEIRGARLVAGPQADQSAATGALWTAFVALRSRIATRGSAHPTYARFVRAGGTVLHTIGPPTHEGFIIESLAAETDPNNPAATWRRTATFTIVVSAVQRFASAALADAGVVGWEQEVRSTFPDGRHLLEWITRISTLEGSSAETLAKALAAIDVDALSGAYLLETGDTTGGVDLRSLDADTVNGRTVTVVEATSRARAYFTTFGSVLPGQLTEIEFSITTSSTADETFTTTRAEGVGAAAAQFVLSKRPAVFNEELLFVEEAKGKAYGVWTQRDKRVKDPKLEIAFQIQVTVSGGGRAVDFEPTADGGEPLEFVGAFLPFVAIVEVEIENVGVSGAMGDMKVPGHPGGPWRLDRAASAEGHPFLKELAATASRSVWHRTARYVYRCATPPTTPLPVSLLAVPPVASLLYPVS